MSSPAEPVHGHTRDLDRELIIFKQECKAERLSEELIRVCPLTLSQRWAIPITLKIKDQVLRVNAFIDSGSDLNCLRKEIVPPRYWDKCSEKAYAVNGAPLQIPHMVWNVHVCRNRVCQNFYFVLLRDLEHDCLLGTTFLSALEKFRIFNDERIGMKASIKETKVFFPSSLLGSRRSERLSWRPKQFNGLKMWKNPSFFTSAPNSRNPSKDQRSSRQDRFFFSLVPNQFWSRHKWSLELPYRSGFF